jgi:hypothetical protein
MPYEAHVVASTGTDEGSAAPPRPAIQAVPLKGLPIVAAIMVFLIAAIAAPSWQRGTNEITNGVLRQYSQRHRPIHAQPIRPRRRRRAQRPAPKATSALSVK